MPKEKRTGLLPATRIPQPLSDWFTTVVLAGGGKKTPYIEAALVEYLYNHHSDLKPESQNIPLPTPSPKGEEMWLKYPECLEGMSEGDKFIIRYKFKRETCSTQIDEIYHYQSYSVKNEKGNIVVLNDWRGDEDEITHLLPLANLEKLLK